METENSSYFVIASFSHNFPINTFPSAMLNDESKSSSSSSSKRVRPSKYRMNVDGLNMSYIGECSNAATGSEWCVMIKNKRTGDVVFQPAKYVTFNPEIQQNTEELDKTTLVDKNNFREMRDLLTLKFGSRQKKRALEAKMASAVSQESLSTMVDLAAAEVKESSFDQLNVSLTIGQDGSLTTTPTTQASSVLPQFNPNATCPAEIYDINDIVTPDDVALLQEEAVKFSTLKLQDIKTAGYMEIISDLCYTLPSQTEARLQRCVYIVYLHYLLNLCKLLSWKRQVDINDLKMFNISGDLLRSLLDRYTEPSGGGKRNFNRRAVSPLKKDRLIAHCMLLLLYLNQFSFSLTKLMSAVELGDKKLSLICRLLGCTVKKSVNAGYEEKTVVLTAPPKKAESANEFQAPFGRKRKFGR